MDGKQQTQFKTKTAIPPNKATIAANRKQPPQQPKRFGKQTFVIGCCTNQDESTATNYAFCLYIGSVAIVPNRIIVPVLACKRVNIDGKIAANSKELSKKQPLCLTREFHVDALRAQHEYRALWTRCAGKIIQKPLQ
jgi:hypothetical protein